MKQRPQIAPQPRPVLETVRRQIMELLHGEPRSAREISALVHIPEKQVHNHLEHIRRSIHGSGSTLELVPASCRACGFVFAKRDRLTSPGRCPVCREESINDPLFRIRHHP